MRTEIKEIKVYKFNELSSEAKEVVKQWWLNNLDPSDFENDCLEELKCEYGIETLNVSFSLGYCQGDGFCMYGEISTYGIDERIWKIFTQGLTKRQKEIAGDDISKIKFTKFDYHYSHAHTVRIEIEDNYENPKHEQILQKVEENVKAWYFAECKKFENYGYAFFYEISEEDLNKICEANIYEFLENGKYYTV